MPKMPKRWPNRIQMDPSYLLATQLLVLARALLPNARSWQLRWITRKVMFSAKPAWNSRRMCRKCRQTGKVCILCVGSFQELLLPDFALECAKSNSCHLNYMGRIIGQHNKKLLENIGVNGIPALLCSGSPGWFWCGNTGCQYPGSKCVDHT